MSNTQGIFDLTAEVLDELITRIKQDVLPLIMGAAEYTLDTYHLDEENNRYMSSYLLGVILWGNLTGRLMQVNWFKVTDMTDGCRLDMTLSNRSLISSILKVDPTTRCPIGGNSIKQQLCKNAFTLTGIEHTYPQTYAWNIGYDFSLADGLGRVTFDRLMGSGGGVLALPVASIYDPNDINMPSAEHQPIPESTPDTNYLPKARQTSEKTSSPETQYTPKKQEKSEESPD